MHRTRKQLLGHVGLLPLIKKIAQGKEIDQTKVAIRMVGRWITLMAALIVVAMKLIVALKAAVLILVTLNRILDPNGVASHVIELLNTIKKNGQLS